MAVSLIRNKISNLYARKLNANFSCLDMSSADPFASDPEDMVVDLVQKKLEVAKLKSSHSTLTRSTLVNTSPLSSTGSGSGTASATGGSGVAQTSTTLSTQIRKLKNLATAGIHSFRCNFAALMVCCTRSQLSNC